MTGAEASGWELKPVVAGSEFRGSPVSNLRCDVEERQTREAFLQTEIYSEGSPAVRGGSSLPSMRQVGLAGTQVVMFS